MQWSWPLHTIWRALPREWAHQHPSRPASRCSIDTLWHSERPIYHSAQSHNLLLPHAPLQAAIWIWDGGRKIRNKRLSRGLPVTAQQGIVDACWQVRVIAPRNGRCLWCTGGNKDERALSRTSWVPADWQAMLFILNHRGYVWLHGINWLSHRWALPCGKKKTENV